MFACRPRCRYCKSPDPVVSPLNLRPRHSVPPTVSLGHATKQQEIPMKSIRKFVYAAVLVFSALNFAPSLASAQDEGGTFRLPHEVSWQNVMVPAGDYRFSL